MMSECNYELVTGVLFQCFASPCVVCTYQLTLVLYSPMTNHFCVIVFLQYACDMYHQSDAKIKIKIIEQICTV